MKLSILILLISSNCFARPWTADERKIEAQCVKIASQKYDGIEIERGACDKSWDSTDYAHDKHFKACREFERLECPYNDGETEDFE